LNSRRARKNGQEKKNMWVTLTQTPRTGQNKETGKFSRVKPLGGNGEKRETKTGGKINRRAHTRDLGVSGLGTAACGSPKDKKKPTEE